MANNTYTIMGKGDSAADASKNLELELTKINRVLENKSAPTFSFQTPSKIEFMIACEVDEKMDPEFTKAMKKTYSSGKDFAEARDIAKKSYGPVHFEVDSYSIAHTYRISDVQSEALGLNAPKPAGLFGKKQSILGNSGIL